MPSREEARAEGAELGLTGAELSKYVDAMAGPAKASSSKKEAAPSTDKPKPQVFVMPEETMVAAPVPDARGRVTSPATVGDRRPASEGMMFLPPVETAGAAPLNLSARVPASQIRAPGERTVIEQFADTARGAYDTAREAVVDYMTPDVGLEANPVEARRLDARPLTPIVIPPKPPPPSVMGEVRREDAPLYRATAPAARGPLPPPTQDEMLATILAANPGTTVDDLQRALRARPGATIADAYAQALKKIEASQ